MNNLEYIDDFFKGELLPDQTKEFEKRLSQEPEFAEEVAFYINSNQIAKAQSVEDKKRRFRELYKDTNHDPIHNIQAIRTKRIWSYIAAIAAMIGSVVVAIYLFVPARSPQELADQYIMNNLSTLSVQMGGETNNLQRGLNLYNQGRLKEALQQFEGAILTDTSNYNAIKYAGIAQLKLKQYDEALLYFKKLDSYHGQYSNPGKFYQAITLMKRNQPGDVQLSKQLLQQIINGDLEGTESARDWLDRL